MRVMWHADGWLTVRDIRHRMDYIPVGYTTVARVATRAQTVEVIDKVRAVLRSALLPPAVADRRCADCQHEPHCLPDVVIRPDDALTYVVREVLACG